jgi:hypothetical protein
MFENLVLRHLFLCPMARDSHGRIGTISRSCQLHSATVLAGCLYGSTVFKGRIKESRPRDARTQEGYVERRKQRKKSNEPLAGYRNRPLRGVTRREESSKEGREEECQT